MFAWLKNLFSKALRAFKRFLKEVYTRVKMLIMAELLDFAKFTVKELAQTPLENTEKREEAFNRIKKEAIKRGKRIRDHDIYRLIENVVTWYKIKGEF